MRMGPVDTRIDHRPDDVLAQGTERVAGGIGLDRLDGLIGEHLDREIRPDPIDGPTASDVGRGIGAYQLPDQRPAQLPEQILVAIFALGCGNALRGLLAGHQLVDQCPDLGLGLLASAREFEVQVDDDLVDLVEAARRVDALQQRDRYGRPIQHLRHERLLVGCGVVDR